MSLLTENNRQYYEGAQGFRGDGDTKTFTTTFNTDLVFGSALPADINYQKNNFKIYTSATGIPGTWTEVVGNYSVARNVITFDASPANNLFIVVQLKKLDGGNYGNNISDKAYGNVVEENYGSYAYTKLGDIVNNFLIAYVGSGKLIQDVKRTDVIFHAKRAMQEFSYDTLKSIKSQELTIPPNLSVLIPQDYVNYVRCSWIDDDGVQRIIFPVNNITSSPTELPIQDAQGIPTQDSFGQNTEAEQSLTEERWDSDNPDNLTGQLDVNNTNVWDYAWWKLAYGRRYGLDPQYSQGNGWFQINERTGKFSFSSDLANKLIVLEYISDGLAYDMDSKVPKMAEDALYAHINHSILSSRANTQEYIVQRYKRERSAKLRNAKIRLSNIKIGEITQVMRGKSKWIKH